MGARLAVAEGYAARHWCVFTLKPGEKEPHGRNGSKGATDDLVTVRRWWRTTDYNIGINCSMSGLVVIDLDAPKTTDDPPHGLAWWEIVCQRYHFKTYQTYFVITPRGGVHVYFRARPDVEYRNRQGALGQLKIPHVDVRGYNGYVVAAGSVITEGEYEAHGAREPLFVPDWLQELFDSRRSNEKSIMAKAAQAKNDMIASSEAIEKAIQGMVNYVMSAVEGERNKILNDTYWWVTRNHPGWNEDTKLHAIWRLRAAGAAVGLTEREINDTLRTREH